MKSKFIFSFFTIMAVVAVAWTVSAFAVNKKTDVAAKKFATNYWVYNSTTTGFADTSKFIMVSLEEPGDQNCPTGTTRPCVYKAATGSLSTKAQLHADLQSEGSDGDILAASLRRKGN